MQQTWRLRRVNTGTVVVQELAFSISIKCLFKPQLGRVLVDLLTGHYLLQGGDREQ